MRSRLFVVLSVILITTAASAQVYPLDVYHPSTKDPRMASAVVKLTQTVEHLRKSASTERFTARAVASASAELRSLSDSGMMRTDSENRVQLFVLAGEDVSLTLEDVQRSGGKVDRFDPIARIVQAWIPLDRVRQLADRHSVRHLRPPEYGASV